MQRNEVANAHVLLRCDAQRLAANMAASAAHAAGATQRELARVRAAVDRTDIDATLAVATLPSARAEASGGRTVHVRGDQHRRQHSGRQSELQRLFGDHSKGKIADPAWRADGGAAHTLDVEVRLIVEVRWHARRCDRAVTAG